MPLCDTKFPIPKSVAMPLCDTKFPIPKSVVTSNFLIPITLPTTDYQLIHSSDAQIQYCTTFFTNYIFDEKIN